MHPMRPSAEPINRLNRMLFALAARKFGPKIDYFEPFGVFLRMDGSMGTIGLEGGCTVEDLMATFRSMRHVSEVFGLVVTSEPQGEDNAERPFMLVVEHRSGDCLYARATWVRYADGDIELEDLESGPGIPELFIDRH